ncbi:MAG: hypothetical protein RLZZ265_1791, partial [Verrucomicrobiota bacterium]
MKTAILTLALTAILGTPVSVRAATKGTASAMPDFT